MPRRAPALRGALATPFLLARAAKPRPAAAPECLGPMLETRFLSKLATQTSCEHRIGKHSAGGHIPKATHQRRSRTLQKMGRACKRSGADVCGRLMFSRGPCTAAARTRRGSARIAPDVRPASTGLQGFKYKYRRGREGGEWIRSLRNYKGLKEDVAADVCSAR